MKKLWKSALYIRLSKDDGDKAESNSISSQREILKEWVKLHPDIEIYDFYVDDGWSGTNFDRPGFQRMMSDIYSGKVDCVIAKDLSRFGRNYTDCGRYLDNEFVRLQIRFIAINNSIDTISNNMNAATQCITVGVQNVINESVAATTSVNVRGTLNMYREQGKFIGSFACYGYMKDPEDHHKLIIDNEVAPIVQDIFKWFIDGMSIIGIAKKLNDMGVPNPSRYKRIKGMNYKHPHLDRDDGLWPDSSVRRILKNRIYTGDMVQGKTTHISYKIQKCRSIPEEEWIVVENTHEAIIEKEVFEQVQDILSRPSRTTKSTNHIEKRQVELFSGLVRCAGCGRTMNKKTNKHSYGTYNYYRCKTSRKMSESACTNHTIRIDKMEKAVFVTIQKMIDVAIDFDVLLERIKSSNNQRRDTDHLQKALQTQQSELHKYEKMKLELYPDWKSGMISQSEYLQLKEEMESNIAQINATMNQLQESIQDYNSGLSENEFISHFKKYRNIDKLTRAMVIELIDEIKVHEGSKITICFKFRDEFEKAVEYIERNQKDELLANSVDIGVEVAV